MHFMHPSRYQQKFPVMPKAIVDIVFAYVVATIAAVITILLWTWDFEVIGLGLLVPLMMTPAMLGFAIAANSMRSDRWCHLVYLALALPMPIYFFSVAMFPSQGAASDGADQMALACLIPLLASSVCGYAVLMWRGKVPIEHK